MKTAVRRVLLMSALMAPGALYALGLGEIKLNSALNQPFDAEIELVSATQEDLGALRAALATNDTFVRYGLDRPAYLADFNFRVAKGSGGRDILRVTSPRPVTEPFVTLLVEANWPRGRLLREYTVLLDPPVYAPGPAASEPVAAAPRVSSGGATSTRASAPVAATTTEPVRSPDASSAVAPAAAPSIEPGSTYRVRNNDTLWEIASAANPGSRSNVNRAMVSIYQNNPQAFDGNINVLRSGSTLRIPDASQISAVSASEASAEVARQYDAWRNGTSAAGTAAASDAGRLRLVTPEQGTTAPSTSTSTAPAAATAGRDDSSGCVGRPRNARQAARGRTCRSQAPARSAQRRTRHAAGRCPRACRWNGRARRHADRAGCNGCGSRARSRGSRRASAAGQAEEAEEKSRRGAAAEPARARHRLLVGAARPAGRGPRLRAVPAPAS